jgi:4-amino-4-deoxy-L-arabinose transferase-like glycosyltransferase
MTRAKSATDRIALTVVVVSSVWFAFTAVWGMFAVPGDGHIGAGSAANTMFAEQMLRWKIVYPAWGWYEPTAPTNAAYICHHPFGQHYALLVGRWLFGHHDFVIHLPAVLFNCAGVPLLYGIAKEKWGIAAGAVAAAAYSVVPIAVGFSNFSNLEMGCIFGVLLFFWGHSRHTTTQRGRYLAASLIGLAIACWSDWVSYALVAPTLGWAFVRCFVLPTSWTPPLRLRSYARWWASSTVMAVGSAMVIVWMFARVDKLGEWLASGASRGMGDATPLSVVLRSRTDWLDFSFTPLAIAIGKFAAPVCLFRWLVSRRDEDVYPLGLLLGAVLQYVGFKQGADVHIFWPQYFAPYFALSLAALAHSFGWLAARVARALAPARVELVFASAVLALGLAPAVAMAHDGVLSLWVWRRTGGRYDDHGNLIRDFADVNTVIEKVLKPRNQRGWRVDAHPGADWYWDKQWAFEGLSNETRFPTVGAGAGTMPHFFWIGLATGLSTDDELKIAQSVHLRIYGDVWLADQREPAAPLDAYSLNEREPNPLEWVFLGGTEPVREIGSDPDPWLTWEWRTHLGQPAQAPRSDPRSLEDMRIAHNAAVAAGDPVTAQKWRARINAELDRSVAARFDHGLTLVGVRLAGSAKPVLESWFEVGDPPTGDGWFHVRSKIDERGRFSLIPVPTTEREMAWPTSLPTKLWRRGFLYHADTVMNHRIGRERYAGYWQPREGAWAPQRLDGLTQTPLAVVP